MYTPTAPEAPSSASQRPLSPFAVRGTLRYGLMDINGRYFTHPHLVEGQWHEWDYSPHDAHQFQSLDAALAASRRWLTTNGTPLTVVML